MNYGLYLSASGVLTNMHRQDVFANNLANVNTVGFKFDLPSIRQRDPEALEGNHDFQFRHATLDRLGGGVLAGKQSISFAPGPVRPTGNPLDVALTGRNAFFNVASVDSNGKEMTYLTRDGRFTRSAEGELVMSSNGHRVLDDKGSSITIAANANVSIEGTGEIVQNGETIARLNITGVNDLGRLVKQGQNLFRVTGNGESTEPDSRVVNPGHVEGSGVDPIATLMNVINATKAVSANGNMIRYHDLLTDRAVNVLGRVVA